MYAQKEKSYIWDVIITCVVLGGCGLILIPMWKREKAEMMETDLHSGLGLIRAQLPLYNKQHDNRWPGENIANQMTELTSLEGFTWSELLEGDERPPSYPFGPYFNGAFPANPYDEKNSVTIVDVMPGEPTDDGGWIYCPTTGEFRANLTGLDSWGNRLFDF